MNETSFRLFVVGDLSPQLQRLVVQTVVRLKFGSRSGS